MRGVVCVRVWCVRGVVCVHVGRDVPINISMCGEWSVCVCISACVCVCISACVW